MYTYIYYIKPQKKKKEGNDTKPCIFSTIIVLIKKKLWGKGSNKKIHAYNLMYLYLYMIFLYIIKLHFCAYMSSKYNKTKTLPDYIT